MSESPIVEVRIRMPRLIFEKLERIAKEQSTTVEDLLSRAIVKVLEEFESSGG